MKLLFSTTLPRAERRAAPKLARIPKATKGRVVAPGDRSTYSSDEELL